MDEYFKEFFKKEDLHVKSICDLLEESMNYINRFDIDSKNELETQCLMIKLLRSDIEIPYHVNHIVTAAFFVVSRHILFFPLQETKSEFCQKFRIKQEILDKCISYIIKTLDYITNKDGMNNIYFLNFKHDLGLNIIKSYIKEEVNEAAFNFLITGKKINPHKLTQYIVDESIFTRRIFPEELFMQLFNIFYDLVLKELEDYKEIVTLRNYLIDNNLSNDVT